VENTDKLAVLIDADNAQPSIVDSLLAEIANYGVASVKRIYGKLGELVIATKLFDIEERQLGTTNSKTLYVRDRRSK
jgi:hypothetical protein